MIDPSVAPRAHESTTPLDQTMARMEEEIAKLRKLRPALSDRLDRASHIIIAHFACRRLRPCDGCGRCLPLRELIELAPDNHDGLVYFDGDRVCRECAHKASVSW